MIVHVFGQQCACFCESKSIESLELHRFRLLPVTRKKIEGWNDSTTVHYCKVILSMVFIDDIFLIYSYKNLFFVFLSRNISLQSFNKMYTYSAWLSISWSRNINTSIRKQPSVSRYPIFCVCTIRNNTAAKLFLSIFY